MSNDYFNPPNSVWPNGLKRDDEGYVNFYTSGTNKVDISTITWPEGTKVKSPFVYQDDKLVGFIDTKALDIDNNDTTININYTHFDADLDSIMENTLTINAPANAVVNVKYGAVDKVLTEKIEKLIGKEKCEVKFDKNNNKATIALPLDTTETQITDVESLLTRVLPSNLTTEMEWADGLPMTYTRLEYLESTRTQYVDTGIKLSSESEVKCGVAFTSMESFNYVYGGMGAVWLNEAFYVLCNNSQLSSGYATQGTPEILPVVPYEVYNTKLNKNEFNVNGTQRYAFKPDSSGFTEHPVTCWVFAYRRGPSYGGAPQICRVYSFSISRNGQLQCNYIPALNGTGTPGMYDTVNKVFKSNMGTGDFLYPTDAAPAVSAGLDETFYAKLTEHGVRRLYHVPTGCNMTKDEYAAANGFKELVEPPMPLEGYWMPVWRETETQLICDWVETEPPTEEV